MSSNIASFSKS